MLGVGKFKLMMLWFAFLTLCVHTNLVQASLKTPCLTDMSNEWMDPEKSLCCDGIHDKIDNHGRSLECCQLNKTNANGDVIPKGRVVYDPQRQLCCGEKVYQIPKHLHNYEPPECCGFVLFNKTTEICCNNLTLKRSEYYCHRGSKEFPFGLHEQVCEKWTKNGTFQWKIHTSKKNWDCCGLELHNENNQTHFCNDGKVWHQAAIVSECGDTQFDKTEAACCNNTYLIPVPKFGKTNATYIGIKPDYVCLDGKLVDQDLEEIREYGNKKHVVPNHFTPCGSTYYDLDNKRTKVHCCKGDVYHTALHKEMRCCGKEIIDTEEHICCNDTKIPVTSTFKCCNEKIYDMTSGHQCCGWQIVDSTHLCCKPQSSVNVAVKKAEPDHNKCCSTKTFSSLEMTCCAGELHKLEDNQVCDQHSGEFIIIDPKTNPKTAEDLETEIKGVPGIRLPGHDNLARKVPEPECPSCIQFHKPPTDCVKKYGFFVYIKDVQKRGSSTYLYVLVTNPPIQMVFQTKGNCTCFKKDELYMFYTNRNLVEKAKNSKKSMLRFSKKDIFSLIKGRYPKYSVTKQCTIDRYLKKSTKT